MNRNASLFSALVMFVAMLAGFSQEVAASSGIGLTGKTTRDGGAGCASCHTDVKNATVTISGASSLTPGQSATYTVTATDASLGSNVKMGLSVAASIADGAALSESAANLIVSSGEVIHTTAGGTAPLNLTNAGGSASYQFTYTMPAAAAGGSTHILYAVARLGFGGSWNHAANFTVTTAKLNQTIAFGAAPPVNVGTTGTVSATGGASGNPVTFTSTTTPVCTVSGTNGSTVTGVAAGICTIAANQAGNTNYNAATQVTQNITVGSLPPTAIGATSRKIHGAAGPFDLALALTPTAPTTEPRTGGNHTIVFSFNKFVTGGSATVTEGTATAGVPTFDGSDMIVPLTGVANQQYVTVTVSGVAAADGTTGGSGSVRLGFLLGDVNQNRSVTLSDLGQVNAQITQPVTAANFLKDVNVSGTLSLSDKGFTNTQITKVLPTP